MSVHVNKRDGKIENFMVFGEDVSLILNLIQTWQNSTTLEFDMQLEKCPDYVKGLQALHNIMVDHPC